MNVALYTAVYGSSDWVKPIPPTLGVPAYFYTDTQAMADAAEAAGWEPRIVAHSVATLNGDPNITEPMLNHKWWKTHPHLACPGVDVSLWVDGSMEIVVPDYVERCLAALGDDDWAMVPHPERNCALVEAELSATLTWRYDAASISKQLQHYARFHPAHWGLMASGANARRHTSRVINVGQQWWHECVTWSHQDQISLPVLLRLAQGQVKFNYNLPWHDWWVLHPHYAVRPDNA